MELNEILKNRRVELGLTMREVANAVGVSEATISRWESGDIENMRRDKIASYAKALHVTPDVIMGWDVPAPSTLPSFLAKYNRLNHSGRDYIDTQLDYALSRPEFVSEKNNDIQDEETA